MTTVIRYKDRSLDLSVPRVMGILNVTPDSFSDGGMHNKPDDAVAFAASMVKDGASIIDVGGESTRPGAAAVSEQEELDRVLPVVEKIAKELDVFISVDTSTPAVMKECAAKGAHLINDVRALMRPGAVEVCAEAGIPVCIMHMQGSPENMQEAPHYIDLLGDINEFFYTRIHECLNAGILRENIVIDPGFGFGKTMDENYELMARLDTFQSFGLPLLVGISRKSMIGNLTGALVNDRVYGSIALALYAVNKGASIIRVHDVKATVQALQCWEYTKKFDHKAPKMSSILKFHHKNVKVAPDEEKKTEMVQ